MPRRVPWTWGNLPARAQSGQVVSYLNYFLSDLESYLRSIHEDVSFGPLAGAYFPVPLGSSADGGLGTGAVDQFPFGWEMRPIALTAICYGGNLTFDVHSEASSILSGGAISLVDATAQTKNSRGDFAVEKVTGDLTLEIDSIDASTPIHLRVAVTCKNASKVEPA